jgi:hypothetical protein
MLNIQVDAGISKDPDAPDVALDPLRLFKMDRIEHLKLFTKIMLYENRDKN